MSLRLASQCKFEITWHRDNKKRFFFGNFPIHVQFRSSFVSFTCKQDTSIFFRVITMTYDHGTISFFFFLFFPFLYRPITHSNIRSTLLKFSQLARKLVCRVYTRLLTNIMNR